MTCNRKYQKSTLTAYTIPSTAEAVNGVLAFANRNLTGCSIDFTAGATAINLTKPGLYLVEFNATVANQGTTGNVTAQLQRNGISVPGATATTASASATDLRSISFAQVIEVSPSCCAVNNDASLTVVNTGVAANYSDFNINVIKLA